MTWGLNPRYACGRPPRDDSDAVNRRRFAMDKKAKTSKKPKQNKSGADKKK